MYLIYLAALLVSVAALWCAWHLLMGLGLCYRTGTRLRQRMRLNQLALENRLRQPGPKWLRERR